MVGKANRAEYSTWSLRETPDDVRARYFRTDGRDVFLNSEVRSAVSFERRNLVDGDPEFWRCDTFDVVFCRNVTMYFTTEVTRSVISRVARSLIPGGFLFLGHAETLRNVSQEFHLRHTHETFYYQRREARANYLDVSPATVACGGSQEDIPPAGESGDSWFNIIHRA